LKDILEVLYVYDSLYSLTSTTFCLGGGLLNFFLGGGLFNLLFGGGLLNLFLGADPLTYLLDGCIFKIVLGYYSGLILIYISGYFYNYISGICFCSILFYFLSF
jgi:hypothetical protein